MICVYDFPCGEVLVKVGIMEFELISTKVNEVNIGGD